MTVFDFLEKLKKVSPEFEILCCTEDGELTEPKITIGLNKVLIGKLPDLDEEIDNLANEKFSSEDEIFEDDIDDDDLFL